MPADHAPPLPALTVLLPWLNVKDPRPAAAVGRKRDEFSEEPSGTSARPRLSIVECRPRNRYMSIQIAILLFWELIC